MKPIILLIAMLLIAMEFPCVSHANEAGVLIVAAAVSSDTAASAAAQSTGGKVLSVESAGSVFLVKVLLADGKVKIVRVDSATGSVIK